MSIVENDFGGVHLLGGLKVLVSISLCLVVKCLLTYTMAPLSLTAIGIVTYMRLELAALYLN